MSLIEITDRKGRTFKWTEVDGHFWPASVTEHYFPTDPVTQMEAVKTFEIRPDDVMVCAYPKAGTHWIWEIVSMVTKGKAEYEPTTKGDFMLEFTSLDRINSAPSPRVLNSHLAVSSLPDQLFSKHTKIVHVMRNPKDIAVSYYHYIKQAFKTMPESLRLYETFSESLPYVTGEYGVYMIVSMFKYYKEMVQFIKDNPTQVLNLHFEEVKLNDEQAVKRVADFLNKDLPDDVIHDIAEKCSFKKLKHAEETYKLPWGIASQMTEEEREKNKDKLATAYRKGETGDWKNHFTVAENEQFDKLLADEFKDCDIHFIYS